MRPDRGSGRDAGRLNPILAAALASSLFAAAPASGEGINFSWDDCGTHGIEIESFACNTNTGASDAVGSFVPPSGVDAFMGIVGTISLASQNDLPEWWKFGNSFCRGSAGLTANFDFTSGPTSCVDPWDGQAVGGQSYDVAYGGPNLARLRVIAAMAAGLEHPVDPSLEYYAFRVRVMHSKTTGTGSCAGCSEPVQLTLNSIQLQQPSQAGNNPTLTTPIDRGTIYWQNAFGPLPAIQSVTPGAGPEGTAVSLAGSGFTGITSVRFNAVDAAFTIVSDNEISTSVPVGGRTGLVLVQGPQGIGASGSDFIVAPKITSFIPTRAVAGNSITVNGVNFTHLQEVQFNGVPATFGVETDTRLDAVVPAGATDGPITVVNAGGSDVSADPFSVGPVPIPGDGSINLSWDDCGNAGTDTKTFACNTNIGAAFQLFASFGAPDNVFQFTGLSAVIGVHSANENLPDWWRLGNGQCRPTSVAAVFDFTGGPFSCLDPWEGQASGGYVYDVGYGGPDRGRLRVIAAVPDFMASPLQGGAQYYAFKISLNRTKTTGTGSCAGCLVPACIGLEQIQLFQPSQAAYNPVLTYVGDRNYVFWQSSAGLPVCSQTNVRPSTSVPFADARRPVLERAWARRDGRLVSFSVILVEGAPAMLEVFDSSGRRVLGERLDGYGVGRQEVRLTARTPLASGEYFARLSQHGGSGTRSFIVLR